MASMTETRYIFLYSREDFTISMYQNMTNITPQDDTLKPYFYFSRTTWLTHELSRENDIGDAYFRILMCVVIGLCVISECR
jgi:hypothetical protein